MVSRLMGGNFGVLSHPCSSQFNIGPFPQIYLQKGEEVDYFLSSILSDGNVCSAVNVSN